MRLAKLLQILPLLVPLHALAADKAIYVGEGRYYGEDQTSSDTAVLRQRNQEQTDRRQDRDRIEEHYERSERRERAYEREKLDRLY